jgi:hypothetical protein
LSFAVLVLLIVRGVRFALRMGSAEAYASAGPVGSG